MIHGRQEGADWVNYFVNDNGLFRSVPARGIVTQLASAPLGTYFIASAFAPQRGDIVNATASATSTPSSTADPTVSTSLSPTATKTRNVSPSKTATPSATPGAPYKTSCMVIAENSNFALSCGTGYNITGTMNAQFGYNIGNCSAMLTGACSSSFQAHVDTVLANACMGGRSQCDTFK